MAPLSVTAMVCSACADLVPSAVTTVQPSFSTLTRCVPALIMGSTAKTIPFPQHNIVPPQLGVGIVGHLGILVHPSSDAVSHIVPHHTITCRFGMLLHGRGNGGSRSCPAPSCSRRWPAPAQWFPPGVDPPGPHCRSSAWRPHHRSNHRVLHRSRCSPGRRL